MFGLPADIDLCRSEEPAFLKRQSLLLANARSGITLACELRRPRQVWLPSYLCPIIVDAVRRADCAVSYYPVGKQLEIIRSDWVEKLTSDDLVITIDYFGLCQPSEVMAGIKAQGACLIEDACQALLTEGVGEKADYVLFSPRKWVGVPDGGILRDQSGSGFEQVELSRMDSSGWFVSLEATVLRREFDRYGGSRKWFELFQQYESRCIIGRSAMSELTESLLRRHFNYSAIAERRRENFQFLASALPDIGLFSDLLKGDVPMGFPIVVKQRDQLRRNLFDNEIYPPVHWPLKGTVPEAFIESHQLAQEMMTLPCDQRYTIEDLERMVDVIRKWQIETRY